MSKVDEKMVAAIHSTEMKRLEGRYGKDEPTMVVIKGSPTIRKWGRVSDDTVLLFPNRQMATYYIDTAEKFKLISVRKSCDKDMMYIIKVEAL